MAEFPADEDPLTTPRPLTGARAVCVPSSRFRSCHKRMWTRGARPFDSSRLRPVHGYMSGRSGVTQVAEYYQGSDLVVLAKGRIAGLRLVATDGNLTAGSGPLVSGTTLALTMAMTGRATYSDELQGDGATTLRERCATA